MLFNRRVKSWTLMSLLIAVWTTSLMAAPTSEPQLASATARELWRQGSMQVLSGDFSSALVTLEQVQKIEPGHPQILDVLNWMREVKSMTESRQRLRANSYEYYVNQAKKYAEEAQAADKEFEKSGQKKPAPKKQPKEQSEKKQATAESESVEGSSDETSEGDDDEDDQGHKWSRSLFAAHAAMLNAEDETTFRNEPWLQPIVDRVLVEIQRHRDNKEWRDALTLYDVLSKIYPREKAYQDGFSYCAKRVHLDMVYGSKSNWRKDLRDVTASSIDQILERMADDYVEDIDFRKLCTTGIEHLIILAEAESLTSTFPALGDKDLVTNFVTRLRGLLKNKVQAKGSFSTRHVRSIFSRILEANSESLRLPESVLVDEFVSGMLEPLDEFTSVIWPSEVDDFNKHTRGDFVGVGIQITQDIGKPVRVESPLEDSPAYKAGIKPGDLIIKVDGKKTEEMTVNQAVSTITGEPGTIVTLTLRDPLTAVERDIPLKRERIKIRTVRGFERSDQKPTGWNYMIAPEQQIAYIRVSGFMDKTVEDLEKALEQIRREGAKGLILDLRFNPGGLLTTAVRMSELFMKKGDEIVMTKGRTRQQNMDISSKTDSNYSHLAIVVMVNEYSASASEIVAGALAGLKEACVIGVRTFGKGSVQNLIPISDNQAYLKLTTAKYYVPDVDRVEDPWYCLHRDKCAESWGVEPHITVKVIPQELTKILRLRREKDLLKGKDQNEIPKEVLERRPTSEPADDLPKDEDPNTDPQLLTALNVLRIKVLTNQPWVFVSRPREVLSKADEPKSKSTTALQR